jgi:AcrR family transcriptional regulator
MTTDDPAGGAAEAEVTTSWRELSVARSLGPARERAERRVQRFLDAAQELMDSASGREFTVQQVVERSGQSLRSFYQYFDGKHELLLALFEESVRSTAEHLRELIADEGDPGVRLHRVAVEYYQICRPVQLEGGEALQATPALAEFAQQLLTAHPKEAARAFMPLVSLFEQLLADAAEGGVVRSDLVHRRTAGVVLQAIMFNAFAMTISGAPVRPDGGDAAEELWGLVLRGIGTGTGDS